VKRRNVTCAEQGEKLAEIDLKEAEPTVRNKLACGKFTAVFLTKCVEVIGATSLRLSAG